MEQNGLRQLSDRLGYVSGGLGTIVIIIGGKRPSFGFPALDFRLWTEVHQF